MCTFCFCLFYVGTSERDNMKQMEKDKFSKKKTQKKLCFLGGCEEKWFFNVVFKKNRQTLFVFRRKKSAHFRCNYLFLGKMVTFFWWPFPSHQNTTKNRGFSGHKGKPKMALLVAKVPFWVFPRKGALLSVIPKSCVPLKTQFL